MNRPLLLSLTSLIKLEPNQLISSLRKLKNTSLITILWNSQRDMCSSGAQWNHAIQSFWLTSKSTLWTILVFWITTSRWTTVSTLTPYLSFCLTFTVLSRSFYQLSHLWSWFQLSLWFDNITTTTSWISMFCLSINSGFIFKWRWSSSPTTTRFLLSIYRKLKTSGYLHSRLGFDVCSACKRLQAFVRLSNMFYLFPRSFRTRMLLKMKSSTSLKRSRKLQTRKKKNQRCHRSISISKNSTKGKGTCNNMPRIHWRNDCNSAKMMISQFWSKLRKVQMSSSNDSMSRT